MIPITLPDGQAIQLSSGGQNILINFLRTSRSRNLGYIRLSCLGKEQEHITILLAFPRQGRLMDNHSRQSPSLFISIAILNKKGTGVAGAPPPYLVLQNYCLLIK